MTFKIKNPPKEPKTKKVYYHKIDEFHFIDLPVSDWLKCAQKYIEQFVSMDPVWDVQHLGLENLKVVHGSPYGDCCELEMMLTIYETDEAFEARCHQWKIEFAEWEEWQYQNADAIEEELARREAAKVSSKEKELSQLKQKVLRLQRELKKEAK